MQLLDNRPLFSLTVSEFTELIKQVQGIPVQATLQVSQAKEYDENFAYGLSGLARLLGCSKQTAFNIKKSGKLAGAITQIGKLIIIDKQKALSIINKP